MVQAIRTLPRIPVEAPSRPSPKVPFSLRAMRRVFRWGGALAPDLMGDLAHRLYFSPRRRRLSGRDRRWLVGAETEWLETPAGYIAAYRWPYGGLYPWDAPRDRGTVLLVHGWEGRGAQLGAFVEPLRNAGYNVVAFDAPAHGRSPGERTNVIEFSDAIFAVAERFGGVDAIVAHSMGVPSIALSIARGLDVERVVMIGGPSRFAPVASRFATELEMNARTKARFEKRIEDDFGDDVWEKFDAERLLGSEAPPALVVHDVDDRIVHFGEAEHLVAAWPDARLVATAGLGHHRILRDQLVIAETVDFVSGAARQLRSV